MLRFEVECRTNMGESVGVCGSGSSLGNWDAKHCVTLYPADYPVWSGEVDVGTTPVYFKYLIIRQDPAGTPELLRWEGDFADRRAEQRAGEKLIVSHTFGDPARDSQRYTPISEASPVAPDASSSPADRSSGCGGYASSALPIERRTLDPPAVLEDLRIEPGTRAFRCLQSESEASFDAKYEVQPRVLGSGMSGSVYVAKARSSGLEVALKTLPIAGISSDQRKMILNEVQNQLSMDHPNICRLLEVYEGPSELRLIIERMQGPDLFDHLSSSGTYCERDACVCVHQMCSAVAYCHSKGVCHRDLKLENFCFESNASNARVKLIDFGLSEAFTALPMTHACGTLLYVAPEVFKKSYNAKCDMWSMGVITYVMLSGRPPFQGSNDRATCRLIMKCEYSFSGEGWERISKEARDFISALLVTDPSLRLSAEAALMDPWIKQGEEQRMSSLAVPLDPAVLRGARALTRSNALKRAVLTAVAPIATVDEVTRWADQFEALDEQGCGLISVKDLAERLKALSASEAEAEALSTALASLDSTPEQISYSAFLAACLSAHMTLSEEQVRELFERMDKDSNGFVSVEECASSLGDLLDMDQLRAELPSQLSYDDFRQLLLGPRLGPSTNTGLRQLLGAHGSTRRQWRVDTRKAKATPDEAMEAARAENAAWRTWAKEGGQAPMGDAKAKVDSPEKRTLGTRAESVLEALGENIPAAWAVATVEAKEGSTEAARRENMAWRLWYRDQNEAAPEKNVKTALAEMREKSLTIGLSRIQAWLDDASAQQNARKSLAARIGTLSS